MSKTMAAILVGFGIVLAGLGLAGYKMAPAVEGVAFIAGVVGGGMSVLWGAVALAGMKGRKWAIVTAIATIVVLLSRAVHVWTTFGEAAGGTTVRLVVTLMFLITVGMLLYLFHGERLPEFYETRATRHDHASPMHGEERPQVSRSRR